MVLTVLGVYWLTDKGLKYSQRNNQTRSQSRNEINSHTKHFKIQQVALIGNFTVVCSVPWPLNWSEAGADLVLLQTFLLFMCKSWYSHAYKPVNMIIYKWKTRRFVTKQGHRQPRVYSKARVLSTQKWPIEKKLFGPKRRRKKSQQNHYTWRWKWKKVEL